jgi:dynein heavy chain 1
MANVATVDLFCRLFPINMEEEVGPLDAATSHETLEPPSAPQTRHIDAHELHDYLCKLVQITLSVDDEVHSLVSNSDASELCSRFITDPLCQAIYIVKRRVHRGDNEDGTPNYVYSYNILPELMYSDTLVGSLAVIKRLPIISADHTLSTQLQILTLPGPAAQDTLKSSVSVAPTSATGDASDQQQVLTNSTAQVNPYEALHACIHHAVNPYFDAYVKSRSEHGIALESASDKRNLNKNSKTGIPAVRRKFAELEQGLLQMQQTVEIPKITFNVHPDVLKIVNEVGGG